MHEVTGSWDASDYNNQVQVAIGALRRVGRSLALQYYFIQGSCSWWKKETSLVDPRIITDLMVDEPTNRHLEALHPAVF
jgi:hypothetical protein